MTLKDKEKLLKIPININVFILNVLKYILSISSMCLNTTYIDNLSYRTHVSEFNAFRTMFRLIVRSHLPEHS